MTSQASNLSIDPTKTALIVVDVQRAFTDMLPFPAAPALSDVLPRISRVMVEARRAGATVVRVRNIMPKGDQLKAGDDPLSTYMLSILEPGAAGTEYDPAVSLDDRDIEVIKPRYSSFVRTELDSLLRARGIDATVVVGLTTNVCVQSTVRDAFQLDYRTITLADCCSEGFGEPFPLMNHEAAIESIARNFGLVSTSDAFIAALQEHAPAIAH